MHLDVLVIGAGQAGLRIGHHLARQRRRAPTARRHRSAAESVLVAGGVNAGARAPIGATP